MSAIRSELPRPQDPATGSRAAAPGRRRRSPVELTLVLLWASSALLVGGAVSLLHVLHNRVDGLRDAFLLWVFFAQVWGLAGAGAAALALLVRRLARLARRTHRNRADTGAPPALERDLAWALGFFYVPFLLPVAFYGRTYDDFAWAGPPATGEGMAALLAALAALLMGAVVAASVAAARWLAARAGTGSLPRLARNLMLGSLGLHLALALAFRVIPDPPPPDASAFRPLRAESRARNRVVVIGLDGADWRVARPLIEQGELPVFRRLMDEGSWGELATLPGANSAVIWASLYTGKRPSEHGVLDFYRVRLPGMTGRGVFPVHRTFTIEIAERFGAHGLLSRRVVDRSFLGAPPLWEILDDLGASIGVVDGYHYSVPARPLSTPGGFFYSYALNALRARPEVSLGELAADDAAVLVQPPAVLRHYLPHAELGDFYWQEATLLDTLAAEGQPDFVNFYAHQPDRAQHWNWKWLEPERFLFVDPGELATKREVIPDLYRDFDRFLGRLLPRLEPGTTLLVVSDHGHSATLVDKMYSQHRSGPPGILLMWGDAVRAGQRIEGAHVYDVAPTVLHLLGFPVGADMPGGVLEEAIAPSSSLSGAPRSIASYDAFAPATSDGAGPDLTEEELENLRALGYL